MSVMVTAGRSAVVAMVGFILHAGSLSAQGAATGNSAAAAVAMSLPEQPLRDALNDLARQTGLQVIYTAEDVTAGITAPRLEGRFTPADALSELLRNSGLTFEFLNARTVAISAAGTARAAQNGRIKLTQSAEGAVASQADPSPEQGVEEVIVTAQKRAERLQDVPVPVSVVSTQELVETNQLRLQDYATRIPGLSIGTATSGVNQTVTIRGMSTGGGPPTVAILIDDVPFSGNTAATGGFFTPDIDPGDLERVEVLRGPQGTLYGASSLGGLIKYVTVDPSTDRFRGRVSAGTTSVTNGHELGYNLRGSANVPVAETLALGISGFTRREPGFIDNDLVGLKGVDEQKVSGGRLSALWSPSSDWTLKLNAIFQDFRAYGVSDVDVSLGEFQQSHPRGTTGYEKQFQSYSATLKGKVGRFDLTSITGYGIQKADYLIDLSFLAFLFGTDANGQPVTAAAQNSRWDDIERFTQEFRVATPIGTRVDAMFGAYYTSQDAFITYDGEAVDSVSGEPIDNGFVFSLASPAKYDEYAGFANLTFHATDRLDVQVGGRQSRLKQSDQTTTVQNIFFGGGPPATDVGATNRADANVFTYLVTPSFKISPDVMVYARLASGNRVGGSNGASCILTAVPCQYGPDKSNNYEIGLKGDFLGRALSVDASLFYIDWQDIQVGLSQSGISYNANAGKAKSQGVELSVEGRPMDGLTLGGWIVWNDAVLTEDFPITSSVTGRRGDRLPGGMEWSGRVFVDQSFPITDDLSGFLGGSANYVGKRGSSIGSEGLENYPSYTRVDALAGLRSPSGRWSTNLFVTNVTDERGTHTGNPAAGTVIYIQPRTVGLNVTRSW